VKHYVKDLKIIRIGQPEVCTDKRPEAVTRRVEASSNLPEKNLVYHLKYVKYQYDDKCQ
jgi:hypothetical protein